MALIIYSVIIFLFKNNQISYTKHLLPSILKLTFRAISGEFKSLNKIVLAIISNSRSINKMLKKLKRNKLFLIKVGLRIDF